MYVGVNAINGFRQVGVAGHGLMLCAVAHKNDILMNRTPGWQMVHAGMGSDAYIIRRCQHGITKDVYKRQQLRSGDVLILIVGMRF